MSSKPARASSVAATLPECEPPRTTFGPPITVSRPRSCAARAAARVVGNSDSAAPSAWACSTCATVGSSWLGRAMPLARQESTKEGGGWGGVVVLQGGGMQHLALELLVAPALSAGVVGAGLGEVLPLALARCVVHQRDQCQAGMAVEGREQVDGVGRRQFAAHMQVVLGAQQVALGAGVDAVQHPVPGAA